MYTVLEPCMGDVCGALCQGRLLNFSVRNPRRGLLEEHPKYILFVLYYTPQHFTCMCRTSVITSAPIALPLLALYFTVLCCWSALTNMHIIY
jgi:hypothetical protein